MNYNSGIPFYRIEPQRDPAAGADWSIVAPGRGSWLLTSVFARLVTSAVVGNRQAQFTVDDQTSTYFKVPLGIAVAAGSTVEYCGFAGAQAGAIAGGTVIFPLPTTGLLLLPGARFRVTTAGIDVGDQWSNICAAIQEFPVGPSYTYIPGTYTQQGAEER